MLSRGEEEGEGEGEGLGEVDEAWPDAGGGEGRYGAVAAGELEDDVAAAPQVICGQPGRLQQPLRLARLAARVCLQQLAFKARPVARAQVAVYDTARLHRPAAPHDLGLSAGGSLNLNPRWCLCHASDDVAIGHTVIPCSSEYC